MRAVVVLFLFNVFLFSCSKEFVPPADFDDETNTSSIIGPTNNANHKSGPVEANFLSTSSVITVASSTLSSMSFRLLSSLHPKTMIVLFGFLREVQLVLRL